LWRANERKHFAPQQKVVWQRHSSQARDACGLPRDSSPWSDRGVKLTGVGTSERKVDLVNVGFGARMHECGRAKTCQDIITNFWVDLGVSISRRPWSQKLRAIHKNSQLYSYQYDRCLTGCDCMQIHGWPVSLLREVPPADLLAMAADGTSLPLVTLLQFVVWANPYAPWRA